MYVIGGLDGAYRHNTPYYHGAGKLGKLAQVQSMSAKDMSEYAAYLDWWPNFAHEKHCG
jgi:hypothetical protein